MPSDTARAADLIAAFDCMDHDILVRRMDHDILVRHLQLAYGIEGSASAWLSSFLTTGETHRIFYLGQLSEVCNLLFGVPQGSVLGPLLFLLYVAELAEVIAVHGITGHVYADDSQMCISIPAADAARRLRCSPLIRLHRQR